jgi:hypothetical protein
MKLHFFVKTTKIRVLIVEFFIYYFAVSIDDRSSQMAICLFILRS